MSCRLSVLFVNPPSDCVNEDRLEPPLGLLYLAAAVRDAGFDVSIYDMAGCPDAESISARIASVPMADVYAIKVLSTDYQFAGAIVERLRQRDPEACIALGGPHPTGLPDETWLDLKPDIVVAGEGEDAFVTWLRQRASGMVTRGVLIGYGRVDIDSYPFPARDLVDDASYARRLLDEPVASLLSSRGCATHCIHCNSIVMGGGSRSARYRSSESVITEMRQLRDRFTRFRFNDDHFTGNPALLKLLDEMKELDIAFRAFARVDDLTPETCRALKAAGCVHLSIGLESLHSDNLKIIGKGRQIGAEGNVRVARDHGLTVRASFMVGLPYDSDDTIREAFRTAAQLGLDEFAIYPLIPYPGTMIWRYPERFGYTIVERDFTKYVQMGKEGRICCALRHERFTPDDVERWHRMATEIMLEAGTRHMRGSAVAT